MIIAITVTGKDRTGIIAALSGALWKAGGNLEDASMTILEGEFAMIFLAALKSQAALRKLREALRKLERTFQLVISMKEIKRGLTRGEKHIPGTLRHIVSVLGKDRSGIVYQVSKLLADHRFNITDLNSKIIGGGEKASYILMLEVDLPKSKTIMTQLKRGFEDLERKLKVSIKLNPIESARL
jgi:glycine cleavage system transcriptional repressor